MGKFKNAARVVGKALNEMADHERKVKELTQTLMNKSYGVEYDQAEKIARVLIAQAEITWK